MPTVDWTEPRRVTPLWFSLFFLFSLANCHQINSKIPIEKKKKIEVGSELNPSMDDAFAEYSVSSVQLLSHVRLFATPWMASHQASLSITNFLSLLKIMSSESVMPSNHLILCRLLLLLPSIFLWIRVFSNELALHNSCPKYWSFSISPSNQSSGLISFRIDWFDFLAVQETLKSLLQHHSSKASIFRPLAFLMVQLSHPYLTTGKTIALTIQMFVSKMMSLLFNMLSRLVIAFLPRSKCVLISWL